MFRKKKQEVIIFADRGACLQRFSRQLLSGTVVHTFIKNPGKDVWAIAPQGSVIIRERTPEKKKDRIEVLRKELVKAANNELPPPGPLYDDYWGNCPVCGKKGSAGDLYQHLRGCLDSVEVGRWTPKN